MWNNTTSYGSYTVRIYNSSSSTTWSSWSGNGYYASERAYKERKNKDLTDLLNKDYEQEKIERLKGAL